MTLAVVVQRHVLVVSPDAGLPVLVRALIDLN